MQGQQSCILGIFCTLTGSHVSLKARCHVVPNLPRATSHPFSRYRKPGVRRELRFCSSLFPLSGLRRSEGRRGYVKLPDVASKTNVEKVEC